MTIKTVEFRRLKDDSGLCHGVFTRKGGVSLPPFDSLNVGLGLGDGDPLVLKNRRLVSHHMNASNSLYLNQIHGRDILVLKKEDQYENYRLTRDRLTADGVITDISGLLLVIQTADCQAVLLYDPVKRVIGNIHSGWRGSAADIIGNAVDRMKDEFGCDPGDITAGIGPSLGPCCAEFLNYREELPEAFWKYRTDRSSHYFNFWEISCDQLKEKGVKPENIEVSGLCTKCSSHDFFSHRKEKPTGRFATAIQLNP
ncbi:MAG: peptidoglycan editing factor PgeF [Desulfobacteraceae bacterium]